MLSMEMPREFLLLMPIWSETLQFAVLVLVVELVQVSAFLPNATLFLAFSVLLVLTARTLLPSTAFLAQAPVRPKVILVALPMASAAGVAELMTEFVPLGLSISAQELSPKMMSPGAIALEIPILFVLEEEKQTLRPLSALIFVRSAA